MRSLSKGHASGSPLLRDSVCGFLSCGSKPNRCIEVLYEGIDGLTSGHDQKGMGRNYLLIIKISEE